MIILSNCLTQTADEGSLKVANSLIKRIKKLHSETTVVSFERRSPLSDRHMEINKLLLNREWIRLVRTKKEPVLYVPFPTRMLPMAVRIFLLTCYARQGVQVILAMESKLNTLSKILLKMSGAKVWAISRPSYETYRSFLGEQAGYLKAGVDTERFSPVEREEKFRLKKKYGLEPDRPVVLHVGHMKAGRNIGQLLKLEEDWQILLVTSTLTVSERDEELRQSLMARSNVTLIEDYCPQIQELYQLADVYFFPVTEAGNCIDVPLSALEAAACGIPVVATDYGELRELVQEEGFYHIQSFEKKALEGLLAKAVEEKKSPRQAVLPYDWQQTVHRLLLQYT